MADVCFFKNGSSYISVISTEREVVFSGRGRHLE